MSSPAPGNKLIGARVLVCRTHCEAIGTYDFALSLDGVGSGQVSWTAAGPAS